MTSHVEANEIVLMNVHSIDTWDKYYSYLQESEANPDKANRKGDTSDSITDCLSHLIAIYDDDYAWHCNVDKSALTSDVSSFIPIEMQSELFSKDFIMDAIKLAGVENETSYGGCGPIALIGILDYFARYLGYKEIIHDPTDLFDKLEIATEVLQNTYFSIFGSKDYSLVWPWDYRKCFNKVIKNHGLEGIITADEHLTLFGGKKNKYWNMIVESIDKGIPVTMFTGLVSGDGNFANHYTNIYGYETWIGVAKDGSKIEKNFIKARLNWGREDEYYCDADILNDGQVGLITYNINYSKNYEFYAHDFAEEFVNSAGGGQYFFENIGTSVTLSNGKTIYTERKRCSYIENQYLVLSPNRANAGTAYLDILFPHSVTKLTVDMSMWGSNEGAINESFILQYMTEEGWKDHVAISPYYDLPTVKDYPQTYTFLFPKNTNQIRFLATHSNPSVDRNKGRIVLDNFIVEYN